VKDTRAKDVQEFFERVATDWDTMRLAYYDERVIERMAAVSGADKGMTVADVGTGTGFVAAGLAPRVRRVLALDNSPAMLEVARKNLADLDIANVDLLGATRGICPWTATPWTPRSPTWSSTTQKIPGRCSGKWPAS
jgi:ubiquinone/menaquinone biosynthesis C-methylase UbiE